MGKLMIYLYYSNILQHNNNNNNDNNSNNNNNNNNLVNKNMSIFHYKLTSVKI